MIKVLSLMILGLFLSSCETTPTEHYKACVYDLGCSQNEVKEIAVTSGADSIVSIKFEGDFDSGSMEVGYTDTNTLGGTFEAATGGTATEDGDFIYTIGSDQRVFARATGASPDINVKTTIVS